MFIPTKENSSMASNPARSANLSECALKSFSEPTPSKLRVPGSNPGGVANIPTMYKVCSDKIGTNRAALALAALACLALAAFTVTDNDVRVIDGDTIEVRGERVRLHGIDAPERDQSCQDGGGRSYPCGQHARVSLALILASRKVECSIETKDRYGRLVGICTVDGHDIGEAMVRAGWAVDFARYSKGAYAAAEADAKANRRGMWSGAFIRPDQVRRELRR